MFLEAGFQMAFGKIASIFSKTILKLNHLKTNLLLAIQKPDTSGICIPTAFPSQLSIFYQEQHNHAPTNFSSGNLAKEY